MKYLRRFNESFNAESEIENIVKDCFQDYITDYSMDISFATGKYSKEYHFMTERFLKELSVKYPNEFKERFEKLSYHKAIKVDLNNSGIGQGARLEIYMDENSESLFEESIHNLKSELSSITNSFELVDVPKLSPQFYGINFLIVYN